MNDPMDHSMDHTLWPNGLWPNGAQAAVCLSYDDTLPCHHQLVGPVLEDHGLRGTFYTPIRRDLIDNTAAWRQLAERGHELGNHTIFHPCRREAAAGGTCLENWNNLVNFTAARFRNEVEVANFVLHLIDGKAERTYGNTCHDVFIGPTEARERIEPILADFFVAARGECTNQPAIPATADLANLGTTAADGHTFIEWRECVEQAVAVGGLLIFTFHGVGRGYQRIQVAEQEHLQLVRWLRDNRDRIWTAPVIEAARRLRLWRASEPR
ncbi:MAG: polysaccharide deacetylase family protein [Armatimonadota bacterium]|nr:polysaccharide deacetylase family protein [Armatimonadota bacterium]